MAFNEQADFWAEQGSPTVDDYEAWELQQCPRHGRHGWPKIRHPERPTEHRYHYRASQLGRHLEDVYALHEWELRALAIGMAHPDSSDLRELALSVLNPTIKIPPPDGVEQGEWDLERRLAKAELDRVTAEGRRRAGADRRATSGTVVHRLYPRWRRGEPVVWPDERIEAATMRLHELHTGFRIDASEQFVVFDDPGAPSDDQRVLAAGTLDARGGPTPGYLLRAPDGTIFDSTDTLVIDYKTGEGQTTKADYAVQPVPYARGVPYDYTLADKDTRDGDSGRRPYAERQAPDPDWALIFHVPIDRPDDAGLVWVNVAAELHWARAAMGIRTILRQARSQCGGVFAGFHEAERPYPATPIDPTELAAVPAPTAVPATVEHIASVTALDLMTRIRLCHDVDSLVALHSSAGTAWTDAHAVEARKRAAQIERGVLT